MTDEADLTSRVRSAADTLYEILMPAIDKAEKKSMEKAKGIVTRDISPTTIAAKRYAHDIMALGDSVESLSIARTFESLMTEIRKQPYSEQVRLMTGYNKCSRSKLA
ncbi:MAG: hypothetical protein M3115_05485 [Thermoproteota archaeon]|nr:hypothetical protein [Thermoproteota archaeon]